MFRPNARSPSITSQESYSAVMITDIVADVPVNPPETEDRAKHAREVTNLAYDGHLDGDVTRAPSDGSTQRNNSAGISRGVILNAVQFGQNNDSKSKSDEKSIQMTTTIPVPTVTPQISEPTKLGFKDMSLSRKVAFGFSFLPSILFVLCFAIILPCNVPKPCIEEIWMKTFNDTEATSEIELPGNVIFTVLRQGKSLLFELDKDNGKLNEMELNIKTEMWQNHYLKCGKIMVKDETDCIVMERETGRIHSFNKSQSEVVWQPSLADKLPSNPAIVSGCKEVMEEVAFAVSNTQIKLLYGESITISECDTVPTRLTPWKVDDSLNIIFICEKNGEDRVVSVPKNVWCRDVKKPRQKPIVLGSWDLDSLKNSTIQPFKDGLVLWSENQAFMIHPNGTLSWRVINMSHPKENRFIFYGNFYGDNKQIAFISSNLLQGLMITLLDPSNGSFVKTVSHLDMESTEMVYVEGKKKDFVLMVVKKTVENIVTTALSQINDISTTIVSLVSDEEVSHSIQRSVTEELALLDLDGTVDSFKTIRELKGAGHKSFLKADSNQETGVLNIFLLSTLSDSNTKTTEVRNIRAANWDKSTKSKCRI